MYNKIKIKTNRKERSSVKHKQTELTKKAASKSAFRQVLKDIWMDKSLYLMFLPVIIYYLVFRFWPMYGVIIAFKKYNIYDGISKSPWVGLANVRQFFSSAYAWRLVRNTLYISLYDIVFGFTAPIIFALLLNEVRSVKFKRTIQTISYLPHFISTVVVVSMLVNFLSLNNGIINNIIELCGGKRIYFMTDPSYFRGLYTAMNVWKGVGWGAIIYIAALSGIDPTLYEAATIDGASRFGRIWHVTIPGIMTTIITMLLLKIGHLLDVGYESIILMYNEKLYETADIISTYVYRTGILGNGGLTRPNYSLATAVGLFQSAIGMILVVFANKASKKFTESALW